LSEDQKTSENRPYATRFWDLFIREASSWAKEHIWWDVLFLVAPALVMLAAFHLKPDYRTMWVTLAVYGFVFLIYCATQLVQIPAKLDRERGRQLADRNAEVATLRAAVVKAETAPSDPFINMLRERQRLEAELRPLLDIEECGIKVVPAIKVGKDESDFRREKIEQLRRDIAVINEQIESLNRKPQSTLPADWKELADRFASESLYIRADWQRGGMGKIGDHVAETWRFAGDVAAERKLAPLCRWAGKLLLKSPIAFAKASQQTQAETDDVPPVVLLSQGSRCDDSRPRIWSRRRYR
jgi:hypothetical protein